MSATERNHQNYVAQHCAHKFSQLAVSAARGKWPWNFWSIASGNLCCKNTPTMAHAKRGNLHHQARGWEDQRTIRQHIGPSRCRFRLNTNSHSNEWESLLYAPEVQKAVMSHAEWAWQGANLVPNDLPQGHRKPLWEGKRSLLWGSKEKRNEVEKEWVTRQRKLST